MKNKNQSRVIHLGSLILVTFLSLIFINSQESFAQGGRGIREGIRKAGKSLESSENSSGSSSESTTDNTSKSRHDRGRGDTEDNAMENEINERYNNLIDDLRRVKTFLTHSSSNDVTSFYKGLKFLEDNGVTLNSIQMMLSNQSEIDFIAGKGGFRSRAEIKKYIIPGILDALEGAGETDYSLKAFESELDDIPTYVMYATEQSGSSAKGYQNRVVEFYNSVTLFNAFVGNNDALLTSVKKVEFHYSSMMETLNMRFDKYRAGEFHRSEGSGIYFVQKNGVTAKSLTASDVKTKIIIDGKTPVHIFVLSDLNLGEYSSFVQLDLVDGGKNPNQNKYVYDAGKMLPLDDDEKELGYKKMIFVPSPDFADVSEAYRKSMFYDCGTQKILAQSLVPGVPQDFTFYSCDNQLKATITIEATQEGIDFLKGMKPKMEKFAIDAMRMEKPDVSNPAMEKKISSGFISNSNGQVKSVLKVVITSKPWFVKKNSLGVTLYRDFYAQVAFMKADGKCYIQKVRCKSDAVNGTFGAMKVYGSGNSYEAREENINK